MPVVQPRSNTLATPQAVFDACKHLETTVGEYTNDQVRQITGGGMAVVSRLVKLYKDHKQVVDKCQLLPMETAINLVVELDTLLASRITAIEKALGAFKENAFETITELSAVNSELDSQLQEHARTAEKDRESIARLQTDYQKTLDALEGRRIEILQSNERIQQLEQQLANQQQAHEESIAAINKSHAETLAQALETQRLKLEAEKADALRGNQSAFDLVVKDCKSEIQEYKTELTKARAQIESEHRQLKELELINAHQETEYAQVVKSQSDAIASLRNSLEQKQVELQEAKLLYQQLITAFNADKRALENSSPSKPAKKTKIKKQ